MKKDITPASVLALEQALDDLITVREEGLAHPHTIMNLTCAKIDLQYVCSTLGIDLDPDLQD